jgi:hypothetical protein
MYMGMCNYIVSTRPFMSNIPTRATVQSVFITMYTHVENLSAILRYKIIFTYDALAITGHSTFGIQSLPGLWMEVDKVIAHLYLPPHMTLHRPLPVVYIVVFQLVSSLTENLIAHQLQPLSGY